MTREAVDADLMLTDEDRLATGEAREQVLPVVEEEVTIGKRVVETGRVLIRTNVEERTEIVHADLAHDVVEVERVAIDRQVDVVPQIRQEGDVLIVPIVEEVVVVQKRFLLKEELRIRTERVVERVEEPVSLRRTIASVDRSPV